MSRTVTMDFREEYEAERTRWLRKRFLWYCAVLGTLQALGLTIATFATVLSESQSADSGRNLALNAANGVPQVILLAGAYFFVLRRPMRRETLLRLVFWLTVIIGSIGVLTTPFQSVTVTDVSSQRVEEWLHWVRRFQALGSVFFTHFVASLFIPWTWREAIRPLIPLLLVCAITALAIQGGGWAGRILFILLSPLVGVPGALVSWWRHSRFRDRFHLRMLRARHGEMQREMVDARRMHEALFPQPLREGPIRFHYCYQPMRAIGGDYLYAAASPGENGRPGALSVVVLDVTGHGVAAALTVNRLYGELERLFAERPDISPGEVLAALNRYVHLTLSKHSVYATALVMRFDAARDLVEWANAGHPPAFRRDAGGRIERLESTSPLLGVVGDDAFDPGEQHLRLGPGDTVIAYTDGAMDAAAQDGSRLRIDGLQRIIATASPDADDRGRWATAILRAIDHHRFGAATDDTLIVEVYRPIS